jgi:asparagine synthase (glutamine-hydrolysing)
MSFDESQYFRVRTTRDGHEIIGSPSVSVGQVHLPAALQTAQDVFAEWHWDGNQAIVRNCKLGFFPIYYYATDKEFGVATSIERLLACGAPSDLDDSAMAVCIRLGWLVGDDTIFRSIRTLPPGGKVVWQNGSTRVSGGYTFPKFESVSLDVAVRHYGELFHNAVKRRASKEIRTGVPLSGGRDSRHILLELDSIGCKPKACFTNHDFPPYREENIAAASLLCNRLGIKHEIYGQHGSRLNAELRKNRLNGFTALENIWCVDFYPTVAKHVSVIYEGTPGDVLSAGSYLKGEQVRIFEQGRFDQLAENLLDQWLNWKGSEAALTRILSEDAAHRFTREKAITRLATELKKHIGAPNPMTSFYFWNRSRRVTALQPFSIAYRAGLQSVTPYLDHELVDFLNSLPAETYLDKKFHSQTIQQLHPQFNDIPYAGSMGTPLVEDNWHYRRFVLEAAAYVALRGSGALQDSAKNSRRLAALAFSSGNIRKRMSWTAPYTTVFLAQLESLISQH